jgi:hypothetical protein
VLFTLFSHIKNQVRRVDKCFDLPLKLTGLVPGEFPSPGSGSLADLRLLRLTACFTAASTNSFVGGLMADFRRAFGSFTSVTPGFSASNLLIISLNSLAGVVLATGAFFAADFGRAIALPFVGLGLIGLRRTGGFKIWAWTSFEASAFFFPAAGCLLGAFTTFAWLVEADGCVVSARLLVPTVLVSSFSCFSFAAVVSS